MIFAKDLILKGVAGLAVVGGLGAGGIYVWNQNKGKSLETLAERVGLSCTTGAEGTNCTITNTKFNVKQDSTTHKGKSKTNPQPSGTTEGKIKVYTGEEASKYNGGFKFVIEEGDITLSNGGGTTPSKLEEFETYEIKEENNQWYLTRKEKSSEAKRRLLGIPNVDTCKLPEDSNTSECQLDAAKLKAIKFEGKSAEGDVTIDDANNGEQIKLKISKVTDTTNTPFSDGYKFVLETNKNITIPKSSNENISIKKGTNTEFKIKVTPASGSGGPRTLTLEKAWDIDKLAEKLGMTCTNGSDSSKECTLVDGKINVFEGDNKKVVEANVKTSSQSNKKLKVQEGVENHNQGFKFYLEGSNDIELCKESETSLSVTKIEKKETATYEIIEKTEGDSTKWYLSKKGVVS